MMQSDRQVDNRQNVDFAADRLAFRTELAGAISGIVDRDYFLQQLAQQVEQYTGDAWVAIYTRAGYESHLLLRANTMPNARPLPSRISSDPQRMTDDVVAHSGVDPDGDIVCSAPVLYGDELVGALVLFSSTLSPLESSTRARVAVLADEVAPAISVAEQHHAVKQSAIIDLTTGAHVSWYVNQRFEEEIARSQRTRNPLTVVFAAVMGFDDYQREVGFAASDALLSGLTAEYTGLTRSFDVVGLRGRAEFTLLLPDTDLNGASTVIARIHQRSARVIERLDVPPVKARVGVVTGAASFPDDGLDTTSILLAAEHRFNQNEILHRRMAARG